MRTPSDALVGPVAIATLRSLHLDAVYMGVHGITERAGFTTPNLMEAETNRAFVAATERLDRAGRPHQVERHRPQQHRPARRKPRR